MVQNPKQQINPQNAYIVIQELGRMTVTEEDTSYGDIPLMLINFILIIEYLFYI